MPVFLRMEIGTKLRPLLLLFDYLWHKYTCINKNLCTKADLMLDSIMLPVNLWFLNTYSIFHVTEFFFILGAIPNSPKFNTSFIIMHEPQHHHCCLIYSRIGTTQGYACVTNACSCTRNSAATSSQPSGSKGSIRLEGPVFCDGNRLLVCTIQIGT